jgi:hypothetical protein
LLLLWVLEWSVLDASGIVPADFVTCVPMARSNSATPVSAAADAL